MVLSIGVAPMRENWKRLAPIHIKRPLFKVGQFCPEDNGKLGGFKLHQSNVKKLVFKVYWALITLTKAFQITYSHTTNLQVFMSVYI